MNKVAENLNAVGDMIGKGHMLCKGQWSAARQFADKIVQEGDSERVGCLEGLMCERLGLYSGFAPVFSFDNGLAKPVVAAYTLNLLGDDDEEVGSGCYWVSQLHETKEYDILANLIIESDPDRYDESVMEYENVVTTFNDLAETTAEDAEMMCRKAALRAEEMA